MVKSYTKKMSEFFLYSKVHGAYFKKHGQKLTYKKGHYLATPQDKNPWVYFLDDGIVRICFSFEAGQERLLGYFIPGMTFAQSGSFFDQEEGGLEYVANTDISVYRISRDDFFEQLRINPEFNQDYVSSLLRNQLYLVDRIVYLGEKRVYARCIRWLQLISKFYGESQTKGGSKGSVITVPMTQDTIADFLHVTRESVSTCLTKLRKKGLISIKHKVITIPDLAKLKAELESVSQV